MVGYGMVWYGMVCVVWYQRIAVEESRKTDVGPTFCIEATTSTPTSLKSRH